MSPSKGDLVPASDGFAARLVGVWSREKLFYIQRYCQVFNTAMQRHWPNRVYVDLMSGPGRCVIDPTGEEIEGSPVIAAGCRPGFTQLIVNDRDPDVVAALQRRMALLSVANARYMNDGCNSAVDAVGHMLDGFGRNTLSLCFIDLTNWQIRLSSLERLTAGRRMDLVVLFDFGGMKRVVHLAPRKLSAFFGDNPDDPAWLRKYRSAEAAGESRTVALVAHYEDRLRALGYEWLHHEVLVEKDMDGTPLYLMLFASKNPRGEDLWRKIAGRQSTGQLRLPDARAVIR